LISVKYIKLADMKNILGEAKTHGPKYSGYSFLPDDCYASSVWLCSKKELVDFAVSIEPSP